MNRKKKCVNIFTMLNDKYDPMIDTVLGGLLDKGIENIEETQNGFYKKITFQNKCAYEFWDENRYYAWLSRGVFYDEYGNRRWSYKDLRPSRKMMNRLYREMNEWFEKEIKKVF